MELLKLGEASLILLVSMVSPHVKSIDILASKFRILRSYSNLMKSTAMEVYEAPLYQNDR